MEAAERYRAEERERAERYRAALERAPGEALEQRTQRARRGPEARGLAARLSESLWAQFDAWLADLVEAFEGWLARRLETLVQVFEDPPPRQELRRPERVRREPLAGWLAREQESARRLLEDFEARSVPRVDPATAREWAKRERERARAWERRRAEREPAPRPAPWEERWREEAESWERIERERALRQLESARRWHAEERERLEP